MRNILTSSQELDNFKIATIEASVSDIYHASVTVPTIARGYRKGDTVTLASDGTITIKTAGGDILGYITISLDTGASIDVVGFNAVSSMVVNTEYPLTLDINYINYDISYTPPTPTTKRLSLEIETDGVSSSDGEWIDDNGQDISYVDMPVDYKGIFLTGNSSDIYDFTPADSSWETHSSLRFRAHPLPYQGIVFKGIKYVPYGGTAFDVDLTQTRNQAIPYAETGGVPQDGDEMVMVFETQVGPGTFIYAQAPTETDYTSQINSWYSPQTVQSGRVAAVLQADDGYLYAVTSYVTDWGQGLYYLEAMKIDTSMNVVEHSQVPTTQSGLNAPSSFFGYYNAWSQDYSNWTNYVDSSITNAQTLGEWIYNNLQ